MIQSSESSVFDRLPDLRPISNNLNAPTDHGSKKAEGWVHLPRMKQAKIIRSKDGMDLTSKQFRSNGYGFLEFTHHAHSLASLRYLNNNPEVFPNKERTMVEFAVESQVL